MTSKSKKLSPLSTLGLWELQNTESLNVFGVQDSKRLRSRSTLGLWELQNTERPQCFWVSGFKKIEVSQHFGTLGATKH